MKSMSVYVGILLSAGLLAGCGEFFLSKEQLKMDRAVRQAVKAEPSRINEPFAEGEPPLHIALSYHLLDLFNWLLARGADPNVRDERGQPILHLAVICDGPNHENNTRTLLKRGAHIDGTGADGGTCLHLAAFLSRAAQIEALLAAGANPNARNLQGESPLHNAATPQPTAKPEDIAHTIHFLVAGGTDVAGHRTNGDTPLHGAALIGSVPATRALLNEGAPVDAPGLGGGTALHVAARFAKAEIAEVLLTAGADPNRRDDRGLTPLACALHEPAVTSRGQGGAGPVDTRAVVDVLRRFNAIDPVAANSVDASAEPPDPEDAARKPAYPPH